jgi:hypothetical protein
VLGPILFFNREAEFGNYVFLVNMTVDEKKKKKKRNSKIIIFYYLTSY